MCEFMREGEPLPNRRSPTIDEDSRTRAQKNSAITLDFGKVNDFNLSHTINDCLDVDWHPEVLGHNQFAGQ